MFEYEMLKPNFSFGITVIESENCLQTWQLNDFTKELMGPAWVKKFNAWAEHALPKQPACYMVGRDKMITHPSIAKAIRDRIEADSKIRFQTSYGMGLVMNRAGIINTDCCA